ncbi:MAG: ACT domain-containing protein [Oscillospiraceae bacterium]|jgi:ACT domain-containing protein
MRAIVTVTGADKVGIIAMVSTLLSSCQVNILDLSQTVMQEFFTMVMLVDIGNCTLPFDELADMLAREGEKFALSIRIQREDIFNAMHRI